MTGRSGGRAGSNVPAGLLELRWTVPAGPNRGDFGRMWTVVDVLGAKSRWDGGLDLPGHLRGLWTDVVSG